MSTRELSMRKDGALELLFPDGSRIRVRWDRADGGVRISAEECAEGLAGHLIICPRSANSVLLKAVL